MAIYPLAYGGRLAVYQQEWAVFEDAVAFDVEVLEQVVSDIFSARAQAWIPMPALRRQIQVAVVADQGEVGEDDFVAVGGEGGGLGFFSFLSHGFVDGVDGSRVRRGAGGY